MLQFEVAPPGESLSIILIIQHHSGKNHYDTTSQSRSAFRAQERQVFCFWNQGPRSTVNISDEVSG